MTEEGIRQKIKEQRSHGNTVTDGCEPQRGCWELNSGLLEEQPVYLTGKPSLQPLVYV